MASRVIIKNVSKFTRSEARDIARLSKKHLRAIALETEKVIKLKVKESLQRPGSSGNLANNMYAELVSPVSWGVGNISVLNQNAPYWRWINFGVAGTGRTTPPTSIGSFSPGNPEPNGGDFRQGRFQHNSGAGGGFLMIPVKPIEPHNYIQRTLAESPKIVRSNLRRIKR